MSEIYAIVETGGKQYRVTAGESLTVDRLPDDEGSKVLLRAVAFRDADQFVAEPDQLEKIKVEAVVAAHERGEKIRIFKYKPKKGYRRRQGHRSELTRLEVKEVKLLTRKPAAAKKDTSEAKDEASKAGDAEAKPAAKSEAKPAAKKAPAKKTPAKKPAAKKTPAKKAPAKKTPAKKTAAKKTTSKKEADDGS